MKKKLIRLLPALITIIVAGVVFCCLQKQEEKAAVKGTASAGNDPAAWTVGSVSETPDRKTQPDENISGADQRVQDTRQKEYAGRDLWVYVCGEVVHPGVYCLDEGARVFEAIEMAGGMTKNAAEGVLNLAEKVQDGERIYVPDIADLPQYEAALEADKDQRININTASEQELMTLPGIGEAKARAIITYREEHPFITIEEIMNVSGIKENSFNKFRHLIRV